MVKMVTHRMMDNLTCMLLAKDELQTHLRSQAVALHDGIDAQQEKMEDSELANDNEQLRRQLVEAAAENDAISRSLQERVASLADVTDAKFKAESEAKVLQVQVKSIQKDMDAHKYELHLLRKQLQIRNDEREQNKKASDASHKQHLDNVKKIARLESECQRLRSLIRQRLPGPAVIAQMRAECEMTTKMGKKSRSQCMSMPSKSLPNSSYLHHQRERDALTERLHSVEDEAKYLKEALAKRSAELQEARQLCARTAMKLSSAQDLVEAMSIGSMPSTPQPPRRRGLVDIDEVLMQDRLESTYAIHGGVYAPSILHSSTDAEEESTGCDNGEEDELSRAESWASALFAELSHLSSLHENAADEKLSSISNSQDIKANAPTNIPQELDLSTALNKVSQKLSHVGERILLSSFATSDCRVNQADTARNDEHICSSATFGMHPTADNDLLDEGDQNFNILGEISHIKCMLLELRRAMAVQGKLDDDGSANAIIDDYEGNYDEISANQQGSIGAGPQFSDATKFSNAAKISSTIAGSMEGDCECTKFNGESGTCTANNMVDIDGEEILQSPAKFSGIATSGNDKMEDVDMTNFIASPNFRETAKFSGTTSTEHLGSTRMIKNSTKFSDSAKFSNASIDEVPSSLNSADKFSSSPQLEPDDVASCHLPETNIENAYVDAQLELRALLQAAQAELELARGKNATLEGELSRVLEEKAEVARELSDTCSQKRTLEAELACSVANVEELTSQVASLKSQLADRTSTPPLNAKLATQSVTFFDMKEEQDLAIARTQLADCQHNIHAMRKQMTSNISNSLSQDVIIDELPFFDYSSQSSKSLDLNSHFASPNINKATKFIVLSPKSSDVNIKKPIDISLAEEEHTSSHQTISYDDLCDDNAIQANNISHHSKEEVESFEKCRVHVDEHSKTCDQVMRSMSGHEVKPSLKPPTKPPKLSTTARITEFFNKAKSAKASVL